MSRAKPLISVVIPNYNYGRYLGQAIDSVVSQTFDNLEIIVVDDGSTDNSIEVAKMYGKKIILIRKENGGVSSARNLGIAHSTGLFVCFLDADDYWESNKVELQLRVALKTDAGLVYSGYLECDSNLLAIREITPIFQGSCENRYRKMPGSAIALLGTSTALIRRDVLNLVGEFDTNLNTSADWDFLRRASKVTNFAFVSRSLVRYRRHSHNMSSGSLLKYYQDNELAVRKMVSEYKEVNLKNFVLNRYSNFRFNLGAGIAFLRSRNFRKAIKHIYRSVTGIIGF